MASRSRLHTAAVPGLLALTALALTGCASQGTIGLSAAGGPGPGSPSATSPASATGSASATGAASPSPGDTGTSAPTTPAGHSSPAAPTSQDPSVLASSLKVLNQLWTDPGCKTVLAGFSDYLYANQKSQAQGIAAIPAAAQKIRVGAHQTSKPGAAPAMTKMAADLQTMYTESKAGQTPDKGPVRGDWQIVGGMCSQ